MKIEELLKQQANITALEVAEFCALICDNNRGHLSVGDIIRTQFGLNKKNKNNLSIIK